MRYKTKADLIEKITENVRKRINSRERAIYKTDVRHVVDALIEEGRNMVIEGDTLTVRGLLTISLQDRPPMVVTSHFGGKPTKHRIGHTKAIKICPCSSLKKAVKERYSSGEVKKDEKILEEVLT